MPPHDKINKMACAPSEDSDQPGHPPSLIRVFAVRMKKAWVLSYPLSASDDSDQTGHTSTSSCCWLCRTHTVLLICSVLYFYLENNSRFLQVNQPPHTWPSVRMCATAIPLVEMFVPIYCPRNVALIRRAGLAGRFVECQVRQF